MPGSVWDNIAQGTAAVGILTKFLLVDKATSSTERKTKFLEFTAKLAAETNTKFISDFNDKVIALAARPGVLEGLLDEFFKKK